MPLTTTLATDEATAQFIFCDNMILIQSGSASSLPSGLVSKRCLAFQTATDWFTDTDHRYTALILESGTSAPLGYEWLPLRQFFAEDGSRHSALAARALGLLKWRSMFRYCPCCGLPLRDSPHETSRACIGCGRQQFPVIAPAVIVLVQRGDEILLARHAQRNTDVFTCLAGYIEQGETAEECVAREIREEAGIEVGNIRYQRSQSWPFPDQLMLGFTADWMSGELLPQPEEIDELRWFEHTALPTIPRPGSLAYELISLKQAVKH